MLYIEIDTQSRVPTYAQIMDQLRALVRAGQLPPRTPLPSVRQLAADLEINPNTVAKAYVLLEREGLIETARRRGTRIAVSATDVARETLGNRLDELADGLLEEAAGIGVSLDELVETLRKRQKPNDRRPRRRSK